MHIVPDDVACEYMFTPEGHRVQEAWLIGEFNNWKGTALEKDEFGVFDFTHEESVKLKAERATLLIQMYNSPAFTTKTFNDASFATLTGRFSSEVLSIHFQVSYIHKGGGAAHGASLKDDIE